MSDKQNIDTPHERRPFQDHGHMDVVTLGDFTLGRGVFEPGWRWSNDVKPIAGTDSCQVHHTGLCLSGQMTIKPDDGEEITIGPGDVIDLDPGHDAWTVGDEPCVLIDTGVAAYAMPRLTHPLLQGRPAGFEHDLAHTHCHETAPTWTVKGPRPSSPMETAVREFDRATLRWRHTSASFRRLRLIVREPSLGWNTAHCVPSSIEGSR